jgi:hypothetical protein
MAKDKEPLQSLTGFVEQTAEQITKQIQGKDQEPQTAEQITEQTKGAMENYFIWLQKAMSPLPWSNTNLNRILVSHATQNVTATFAFVQKLSQAKNFQDVVKIQTEFMNAQLNSFNDQAKSSARYIPTRRLRRRPPSICLLDQTTFCWCRHYNEPLLRTRPNRRPQ